ncbi:MAG: DNRLRE domain-containing protein [Candidatus Hodarchaeota archaeon]
MRQVVKENIQCIFFLIGFLFFIIGLPVLAYFKGYDRTIQVDKDAHISEYNPDVNYGSDNYLRIGEYGPGKVHAYYHFNISSHSYKWKEAWIYVKFDYGTNLIDIGVNLTTNNWDEMTITWNNKPESITYKGHILCDGFDFRIPVDLDQITDDGVSVCLYGKQEGDIGYIQGYSKEGASYNDQIAWIELSYIGYDPIVFGMIVRIVLLTLGIIGLIIGITVLTIRIRARQRKNRVKNVERFGADWINANIPLVNRPQVNRNEAEIRDIIRNPIRRPLPNMPAYMRPAPAQFEKKINDYITLRFENYRTIIYVAGRRIIQCVHLILNIPKDEVPMYDDIDSIDEAADLSHKYGHHLGGFWQGYGITPEQEFWGHCSNIQAWVENDYDTRILMSNLSFPLLRELTRAGDPVAKRVYKEEIARRLESGYPSVVQYLLTQGYIEVFTPSEFESILEATDIIKNLSTSPGMLNQFLRSCFYRFPTLIENILLQILELKDGKNIIFSIARKGPVRYPLLINRRDNSPQFVNGLLTNLESLLSKVEENKTRQDILDCIKKIKNILQEKDFYTPNIRESYSSENIRDMMLNERFLEFAGVDRENQDLLRTRILERIRERQVLMRNEIDWRARFRRSESRCSFCGRTIPRGQDTCEWCGHRRDDDDDFFPYPFIFRRPGGGGSMKGAIAVPVNIKTKT